MNKASRCTVLGLGMAMIVLGWGMQSARADETRWPDPEDLHEIKQETGDNPWLEGEHPPTPENRTNQWQDKGDTASNSRFPDPDYSPYQRPSRRGHPSSGEYLTTPYSAPAYPYPRPGYGVGGYPPGYGYVPPYGVPRVPPPYWDDDGTDFPFFDGGPWDFDGFPFSPFRW
ncbi:MAG: hypothetical protein D6717_03990 [Gammaproteobacteria bacterium]|nr:MAG: hypothetical protein D6717_03990 [Gammaproteobacteria bacterium]